jgi:hypothetical protein
MMREFLRRRQLEESGVTGVSIWAESHAAIHTWDEDNYYVNLFRFQRSIPRVSNFQVNEDWEVLVDGRVVGELDSIDFGEICGRVGGAGPTSGTAAP